MATYNKWKNYIQLDRTLLTFGDQHQNDPFFGGSSAHEIIRVSPPTTNPMRYYIILPDGSESYARGLKFIDTVEVEVSEGSFELWNVWRGISDQAFTNLLADDVNDVDLVYIEQQVEYVTSTSKVYKGQYALVSNAPVTDATTDWYIAAGTNRTRNLNTAYEFGGATFDTWSNPIAAYLNTATYTIDEYTIYSGSLYQNDIAITVGEEFDTEKWTLITSNPNNILAYEAINNILIRVNQYTTEVNDLEINKGSSAFIESVDLSETDSINNSLAINTTDIANLKIDTNQFHADDKEKVYKDLSANYINKSAIEETDEFYLYDGTDGKYVDIGALRTAIEVGEFKGVFQTADGVSGTVLTDLLKAYPNEITPNEYGTTRNGWAAVIVDGINIANEEYRWIPSDGSTLGVWEATGTAATTASGVSYSNTISELSATNVQDAIDEVEDRVDTAEADIDTNEIAISLNTTHRGSDGTDHANVVLNDTHRGLVAGNPHIVTQTEVGLSDVDNTSDVDKPVSTATQTALDLKVDLTAANQTITGNVNIVGDFTVSGAHTQTAPEEVLIEDAIMLLNSNVTTGTPTENSGIEVSRGNLDNASVYFNETTDVWEYYDGTTIKQVGSQAEIDTNTGGIATKEDTANKATDFTTVNNTLFPTVSATKTYVDNEVATEIATYNTNTVTPINNKAVEDRHNKLFSYVGSGGTLGRYQSNYTDENLTDGRRIYGSFTNLFDRSNDQFEISIDGGSTWKNVTTYSPGTDTYVDINFDVTTIKSTLLTLTYNNSLGKWQAITGDKAIQTLAGTGYTQDLSIKGNNNEILGLDGRLVNLEGGSFGGKSFTLTQVSIAAPITGLVAAASGLTKITFDADTLEEGYFASNDTNIIDIDGNGDIVVKLNEEPGYVFNANVIADETGTGNFEVTLYAFNAADTPDTDPVTGNFLGITKINVSDNTGPITASNMRILSNELIDGLTGGFPLTLVLYYETSSTGPAEGNIENIIFSAESLFTAQAVSSTENISLVSSATETPNGNKLDQQEANIEFTGHFNNLLENDKLIITTYQTLGNFSADTNILLDNLKTVDIFFPNVGVDSGTAASLSIDNTATYYPVRDRKTLTQYTVGQLEDKRFVVYRNGLNVLVDEVLSSQVDTTDSAFTTLTGVSQKLVNEDIDIHITNLEDFYNGTILETFDALTYVDGTDIKMTLEKAGTGDLTMRFSDGQTVLDCTPAQEIILNQRGGSNLSANNFVYITKTNKILEVSSSDWPNEEHIRVAYIAGRNYDDIDAVVVNQNWNDHSSGTDEQGHLSHITSWIRRQGASWDNGIDGNGSDGYIELQTAGTDVYIKTTAGTVSQLHLHSFSSFDTSSTDYTYVVNWFDNTFTSTQNLNVIINDSQGTTLNNKFFNLVLFATANKAGDNIDLVAVNLPDGSYTKLEDAINDVSNFDRFDLPVEMSQHSGTAFLLAKITMKKAGTSYTVHNEIDLRNILISGASGGSAVANTEFSDDTFLVYDADDITREVFIDAGNITTGNSRTIFMADTDVNLADIALKAPQATTYTKTEVDALTWTESDITDLDKYTQLEVDNLLAGQNQLDELTDVTITGGADKHVLVNNGSNVYVNRLLVEADISDFGSYETANANIQTHIGTVVGNPHVVTKTEVGLGNVDNTSDVNKPVSTATQTALDLKVDDTQVLTDVPAGAVFTDTTYSIQDGELSQNNLTNTLKGNYDTAYTHSGAAHAPTDANNYIHPTGDGNLHVLATSTTNNGKVLTAGATAGVLTWETPASGGASILDGLTDVTITTPAIKHALMNNGAGLFVNRVLVEADISDFGSYSTTGHGHNDTDITLTGTNEWFTTAEQTKLSGIDPGAEVNVGTNIAQGTRTSTTVPVTSSTGSNATLSVATTSLAGVMSSADKTKLDTVDTSANNYSHPDYSETDLNTSTAQVIDVMTIINGHVDGITTRNLTLANLGYTGTTDANTYVHPTTAGDKHIPTAGSTNQALIYGGASGTASWATLNNSNITNGAGYTTNIGDFKADGSVTMTGDIEMSSVYAVEKTKGLYSSTRGLTTYPSITFTAAASTSDIRLAGGTTGDVLLQTGTTTRLTISTTDILAFATYTPSNTKSLVTKEYVDGLHTASTSQPSGGSDGDIWFVYE